MKTICIAFCCLAFVTLSAKEITLPVGSSGVRLKVGDADSAATLAFLHGKTPLCSFRLMVELYERPGVGWQGVGADWTSFRTIRDLKTNTDTPEYTELTAEAVSERNAPPIRPLKIRYRLRVWKKENKVSMKLLSVTGTGPIEVNLRAVALPITFQSRKTAQETGNSRMTISFSPVQMRIAAIPPRPVGGDLLLRRSSPLWLMRNEPFDPEIPEYFWTFTAEK